jgi:hypothetical protein
MDELFRDRHEVHRRGRAGSLVTAADQDVLLEAVGQVKTDWRAYQARVSEASGDTDGSEQEGLLASCQDVCDQLRLIERILTGSGACFTTRIVDRDSLSGYGPMTSTNRHVRTRMRGGVGRDG